MDHRGVELGGPHLLNLALIDLFYRDQDWAKLRRPGAEAMVRRRLAGLASSLGDKPYLDGDCFTAGDLLMSTVLRILNHTDLIAEHPNLAAYKARCEERPAFGRALAAQLGDFVDRAA